MTTSPYESSRARIRPRRGQVARWHVVDPKATWRALCGARLATSGSGRTVFVHDESACRTCVQRIHQLAKAAS